MSQYRLSRAQREFLKRKYAKERADAPNCDCPGCDECTGFVRGCRCTVSQGLADLREVLNEKRNDHATQPRSRSGDHRDAE